MYYLCKQNTLKINYNLVRVNFLSNELYQKRKNLTHTSTTYTGISYVYIYCTLPKCVVKEINPSHICKKNLSKFCVKCYFYLQFQYGWWTSKPICNTCILQEKRQRTHFLMVPLSQINLIHRNGSKNNYICICNMYVYIYWETFPILHKIKKNSFVYQTLFHLYFRFDTLYFIRSKAFWHILKSIKQQYNR